MNHLFTIIPQIIILLSLAGIIFIVVRKFPDIATVKVEKNEKRTMPILGKVVSGVIKFSVDIIRSLFVRIVSLRNIIKEKRTEIKEKVKDEIPQNNPVISGMKKEDAQNLINKINPIKNADKLVLSGKFKEAEKIYLEIIQKDPKNTQAYKSLGKLYLTQKNLSDARASFEQVVKLNPNDFETGLELEKIRNLKHKSN